MRRIILVLTVTAMMMVTMLGSALPALADSPPQPSCDWYLDHYIARVFGTEWWGYWCDWGQDNGGWVLYGWWNADAGWIPLS
jgi:hypothetical protein